jgi:hypothetical protein
LVRKLVVQQEMDHFLKAYPPDEPINIISTIIKGAKRVYKTNSCLACGDIPQAANINVII